MPYCSKHDLALPDKRCPECEDENDVLLEDEPWKAAPKLAYDNMRKQRDELLAALEAVHEWCDLIEQNYPEMLFTKQVRAAIAAAKRG